MAKLSGITATNLTFQEDAAPSTPASTKWVVYFKTDGLYYKDDAGTEVGPLAAAAAATFVGVRAKRASGTVSLGNNTITAIGFDAEDYDTDAFHDNSTNPSRFTVPSGKGGKYLIGGTYYTTTAIVADALLRVNGSTLIAFQRYAAGSALTSALAITEYALSAGDYVELCGRTPSGSGTAAYDAGVSPIFWMHRIA